MLAQLLLAVHVTVVVPVENEDPDAGKHVTVGTGVPFTLGEI